MNTLFITALCCNITKIHATYLHTGSLCFVINGIRTELLNQDWYALMRI